MAINNRTEVSAFIEALAAVVDLEELKAVLNDEFAQSVLFRKDVSSSDVSSAPTKSIDFLDIDYIAITQTGSVTYTLSNIQQGEIKYLRIQKTAFQTVTFTGVIDTAPDTRIWNLATDILYKIINKDGTNIYAVPMVQSVEDATTDLKGIVEKATTAERNAGTAEKYIDSELLAGATGGINRVYVEIGDWNMDANANILINHGQNITDIIGMTAIIRNDTDSTRTFLIGDGVGTAALSYGSSMNVTATQISLNRVTSGVFDGTDYDSTSYNRGWVILELLA